MPEAFPTAFDYTMMSTFLRCRKRYYFRIVRDIVGKTAPVAADFGRAIHKALKIWFSAQDPDKAIDAFISSFIEDPTDAKRTHAVGRNILHRYFEKYAQEPFTVLENEKTFRIMIPGTNLYLIGRIDKIINLDGVIYVMDHKTTSRLGYEFFYKIKPNMQFDGYITAARQMGYPKCDSVFLDVLLVAKGLLIPAQAAKLTPLARLPDTRSESDLAKYLVNVRSILKDIASCYESGVWYENTEGCCDFVQCPYRRICKEDESIHEQVIKMDYMKSVWSPSEED